MLLLPGRSVSAGRRPKSPQFYALGAVSQEQGKEAERPLICGLGWRYRSTLRLGAGPQEGSHGEEPEDTDEGGEPEGGQTDHERERDRESGREPGHGDELSDEPGLDRPDAAGEHAQDPDERAGREDEDDEEEDHVRVQPHGAQVHREAFEAPGEEGEQRAHDERSRPQQLVRRGVEVAQVRDEAVEERQLEERSFGQEREPLGAEDGDAEGCNGQEHHHRGRAQVEGEGAQEAPRDHPGAVRRALGDDRGGGARDRRARSLADEDALQDLPELARRDRHREPGGEDRRVDTQRDRDLEYLQVVQPAEEASHVREEDEAKDRRHERVVEVVESRAEVRKTAYDREDEVDRDAESEGDYQVALQPFHSGMT